MFAAHSRLHTVTETSHTDNAGQLLELLDSCCTVTGVIGQLLDSWWTVAGQLLDNCWPVAGQLMDSYWSYWTVAGQLPDNCWTVTGITGQLLDSCRTIVGQLLELLDSCWPVARQSLDSCWTVAGQLLASSEQTVADIQLAWPRLFGESRKQIESTGCNAVSLG